MIRREVQKRHGACRKYSSERTPFWGHLRMPLLFHLLLLQLLLHISAQNKQQKRKDEYCQRCVLLFLFLLLLRAVVVVVHKQFAADGATLPLAIN